MAAHAAVRRFGDPVEVLAGPMLVVAVVGLGVNVVAFDHHVVLDQAREVLAVRHRITRATLQVEPDDHRGCEEMAW